MIGNYIGVGRNSGGAVAPDGVPTGLTGNADSVEQITLSWTGVSTNKDGTRIYISSDGGANYTEKGTVSGSTATYPATGLTADSSYKFYVKEYKGAIESTASNIVTVSTWAVSILMKDDFTGTTVDTNKWTKTDAKGYIVQNGKLGYLQQVHEATTEFDINLKSVAAVASGIAVIQAKVDWGGDQSKNALAGIYLWKDNNNFACISSRTSTGTNYSLYRLRIYTGGTSRYNATATISKGKDVKIWTDGTTIKFYYWDSATSAWVQMGTTQTFSLGYSLYGMISGVNADTFYGAETVLIDDLFFNNVNTSVHYPDNRAESSFTYAEEILSSKTSYCWFSRNRAVYNAGAGKTFIGQSFAGSNYLYASGIIELTNATGAVVKTKVSADLTIMDDHIDPSILIRSSDNKLIVCYSKHSADQILKWKISTNALDSTAWGTEKTLDVGTQVCYPCVYEASNGDIFIFFRGIDGYYYVKSTDGGSTINIATLVRFAYTDQSYTYTHSYQSPADADIIHFAMSAHPDNNCDNYIVAFYFDAGDATFHKLDGTDVTSLLYLTPDEVTWVLTVTRPDTAWLEDLIVDSNGYPRYLLAFYPDGKNTGYLPMERYYVEWTGTALTTPYKIHTSSTKNIGSPFNWPMGVSGQGLSYPPLSCFDRNNPNRIFASIEVDGIYEIFELTRNAYNNFSSVQRTSGNITDQWRPICSKAPTRNVYWLNVKHYYSYFEYDQDLICKTL